MSKHILIVDDSKTVRNLVAFIMKKEGFKVTTAEDGLDGLEKLYSSEKVDLIISDVNMPRMDGFTFIKTVREQEAYRDLPIVVLSTEGQEKDIQMGMSLGANLYMVKPAQPEKMVKNIKMLLGLPIQCSVVVLNAWHCAAPRLSGGPEKPTDAAMLPRRSASRLSSTATPRPT